MQTGPFENGYIANERQSVKNTIGITLICTMKFKKGNRLYSSKNEPHTFFCK